MESIPVKEEALESAEPQAEMRNALMHAPFIDLSSSISGGGMDTDDDDGVNSSRKKHRASNGGMGIPSSKKKRAVDFILPAGFLDPLPPQDLIPLPPQDLIPLPLPKPEPETQIVPRKVGDHTCKQFWKAGDYEGSPLSNSRTVHAGMDHVRVHPKFLHSNATSHKWALGAFAELLDNSLDESSNGATYVNVDVLENKKDGSRMLMIQDNGGGMDPDKMRQCMSLGYSVKSKRANTIGQYGNGFKTSTMRLGADVIVFSRCPRIKGTCSTQSIGLLSYTFLRSTRKEDIVVPMLDYEKHGTAWSKIIRSSEVDWNISLQTIVEWSPFSSEADLLLQFNSIKEQGTRIIIYNLWEDDRGELELDFLADLQDIQIRGVNRDEKKIKMAQRFPNSRHFLTYRHSLRSYASILYLRLPLRFRIILRGKDVEHHNIVNDMMLVHEVTYRPQSGADGVRKDANMVAVVTMGFVKDAENHIDVQGFNVYHKNRLIKPFWKLWNSTGSDGRGVIGVLEANFVEPAHDKQGFERTTVLSRLETKLIQMQKTYWYTNCHHIGYAPRRNKKAVNGSSASGTSHKASPEVPLQSLCWDSRQSEKAVSSVVGKAEKMRHENRVVSSGTENGKVEPKFGKMSNSSSTRLHDRSTPVGEESADEIAIADDRLENVHNIDKASPAQVSTKRNSSTHIGHNESEQNISKSVTDRAARGHIKASDADCNGLDQGSSVEYEKKLDEENRELKERLKNLEETTSLQLQFEKDKRKSLEAKIHDAEGKLEEVKNEQEALIDIFSEERIRRDKEEENLRKKLKEASKTMQELLEKMTINSAKLEREV